MSHPFVFRPGTNDEAMFHHLMTHDEYRLPATFGPGAIVVDIGVHIGSFSYLALRRGAPRLFGFEAEPSNYECARRNLASFGDRFILQNKAVWRSDVPGTRLTYAYSSDTANTGGGGMFFGANENRPLREVETISLDRVLTEATEGGRRRVSLLKIDCEGSEFPILLTARRLDLVDRIAGEFHELGCPRNPQDIPDDARVPGVEQYTVEALVASLNRAGFDVTWQRQGDSALGLFFAENRSARGLAGRLRGAWDALGRALPRPHFRTARTGAALAGSDSPVIDKRTPR